MLYPINSKWGLNKKLTDDEYEFCCSENTITSLLKYKPKSH